MPSTPSTEDILTGLSNSVVRWGPEGSQSAALLHIAEALQEKNRLEAIRLKFDILNDQTNFTSNFRQKLVNDITTELS